MKKQLIGLAAVSLMILWNPATAGPVNAKVGGDFESKVAVKTVVQAGLALKADQQLSAGSVECAEVAGDFRTHVKQDSLVQAGIGLWVNQNMTLGSVRGGGCSP